MANMRMDLTQRTALDVNLDINLMLNPRMLQMLKILNLPYAELIETIKQRSEENPLIEIEQRDAMIEYLKFQSTTPLKETLPSDKRSKAEAELENYIKKGVDLAGHLYSQVGLLDIDEQCREVLEELIGHVDSRGYISDWESACRDISEKTGATDEILLQALKMLQSFEPDGIGARDLKECLIIQIDAYCFENEDLSGILKKAVSSHLDEIASRDVLRISHSLGISEEAASSLIDFIKNNLAPYPGSAFSSSSTPAIPSFSAKFKADGLELVNLEEKYGLQIKLNPQYLRMLSDPKTDADTLSYIKEKMEKAQELMEQLRKRLDTMEKIAREISLRQKDYITGRTDQPLPLLQKDLSDKFGVHPSTISRALSEKYIETPRGVLSLRALCPKEVFGTTTGSLKDMVRDIISKEDKDNPLSDGEIRKLLSGSGFDVKRRTVADYRKKMSIGTAGERKANGR